jgi:hypothetical protein
MKFVRFWYNILHLVWAFRILYSMLFDMFQYGCIL